MIEVRTGYTGTPCNYTQNVTWAKNIAEPVLN